MADFLLYSQYKKVFEEIPKKDFERLAFIAERNIDNLTTGVDGVRKLRKYFPEEAYDVKAVEFAVGQYVSNLYTLEQYQKEQLAASGYEKTDQGYKPKNIASLSSGSESISFSSEQTNSIMASMASQSPDSQLAFLNAIAVNALQGVKDKNGVNILFRGLYPRGCRK